MSVCAAPRSVVRLAIFLSALSVLGAGGATAATRWERSPAGPPARGWHAVAYDGARERVVLFGGAGAGGGPIADTWVRTGASWSLAAPLLSPPARSGHALAHDGARARTVLFGGLAAGGVLLDDTWEWNGTSWLLAATVTGPRARALHALAHDDAGGRVVLFGGIDFAGGSLADTWRWDGASWSDVTPPQGPPARWGHALAGDSARGRVVLFGGYDVLTGDLGDTWEWDGSSWSNVTPASSPPARFGHSLAYDLARGRVVLFGGRTSAGDSLSDTWEWDGRSWVNVAPAASPPSRSFHAMAYDGARGRVVLFGGHGASTGELDDAWEISAPLETVCDGLDDDGDGQTDEGCDDDLDGHCDAAMMVDGPPAACPLGEGDCDDTAPSVHPGAAEICNGRDDDCDASTDEDGACPPGVETHFMEAESGAWALEVERIADAPASGGFALRPRAGLGSRPCGRTGPMAVLDVHLLQPGLYHLWVRLKGTALANDALCVGFPGRELDRVFPSTLGAYEWVRAERLNGSGIYTHNLEAGVSVVMIGRGEELARIDALCLTNDLTTTSSPCAGASP